MSTGNKRRRTTATANSGDPSTTSDASKATLARLNELLAEALTTAKAVKPGRGDGSAIKKARRLVNSLLKALPIDTTIQAIGYDAHKVSLDKSIKALQKDCKRNWKDGYEEQGEMMEEIGSEIVEWISDLWRLMVEDDADLTLIKQALILCSDTVDRIWACHSRLVFLHTLQQL